MASPVRIAFVCQLILFAASFLVILFFSVGNTPITAETIMQDNIADAIKAILGNDSACIQNNQKAMKICIEESRFIYGLKEASSAEDPLKSDCCARLLTYDCLIEVAQKHCGRFCKLTGHLSTTVRQLAIRGECKAYGSPAQCVPSWYKILLIVVAICSILISIGTICYGCIDSLK